MERIERLEALSPLLSAQLKQGVYTNHYAPPAITEREMRQGWPWISFPGGLWLRRRRGGHWTLTFYLQPGAALPLPPLDGRRSPRWSGGSGRGAAAARPCAAGASGLAGALLPVPRERPAVSRRKAEASFPEPAQAEAVWPFCRRSLIR